MPLNRTPEQLEKAKLYWNLNKCNRASVPFNIIIGGRGTGKTYTTLCDVYEKTIDRVYDMFMYFRRTEREIERMANPKFNPFKRINEDFKIDVQAKYSSSEGSGEFIDTRLNEEGETVQKSIGYASAMATFAGFRGPDLFDVSARVYDEFIPQKGTRRIKDEADNYFNSYETICRNREAEGKPPLKDYLLSNATQFDSPILAELGLITELEWMIRNGQRVMTDYNRGVHIEYLEGLEITEIKKQGALAKLTQGTRFYDHSFNNNFSYDSFENIKTVKLREYEPFLQVEDIYIYQHKLNGKLHACATRMHCKTIYKGDAIPLFRRNYGPRIHRMMCAGGVTYDTYSTKSKLLSLVTISNK